MRGLIHEHSTKIIGLALFYLEGIGYNIKFPVTYDAERDRRFYYLGEVLEREQKIVNRLDNFFEGLVELGLVVKRTRYSTEYITSRNVINIIRELCPNDPYDEIEKRIYF